jgi:hypothetical protein
MNEKVNRAVATGLLALMIANFCACDSLVEPKPNGTTTQHGSSSNNYTDSETTINGPVGRPIVGKDLPGDIWKEMKANGTAYARHDGLGKEFYERAVPLQFLQDEGLVYPQGNVWGINADEKPSAHYEPLYSKVFIDENTKENDVYILLNYTNKMIEHQSDEDACVTTWKLKYTLDDDDYQAILKLKNDYRLRYFVQEMDKIYEPEVISKCTTSQFIVFMSAPYYGYYGPENVFPLVYIVDVDYDTNTITSALKTDDGYKFIDYNIMESPAIDTVMKEHNLTREQVLSMIKVKSVDTPLGKCLTHFNVHNRAGSLGTDKLLERYENTTRVHKLTDMGAGSMENTFEAAK